MWCILPGLALTPDDYRPLASGYDHVRVLDSWKVPVTGSLDRISEALHPEGPVHLIGHSVGRLTAIEWALRYPDEVQRLILLDPSTPGAGLAQLLRKNHTLEVAMRPLIGLASVVGAPMGPAIRRRGVRLVSGRSDALADDVIRERFGHPRSIQLIMDQWFQSWNQEKRVGDLIDAGYRFAPELDPIHVVGSVTGTDQFTRDQCALSRRFGTRLTIITGCDHLFPLTVPYRVWEASSPEMTDA